MSEKTQIVCFVKNKVLMVFALEWRSYTSNLWEMLWKTQVLSSGVDFGVFDQFCNQNFILNKLKFFFEGSPPTLKGAHKSLVIRGLF